MVFKFVTFDPAQDPDAFNPAFPPTPSSSPPATLCQPCECTCTFTRALLSRLVAAGTSLVLSAPGFEFHHDEIRDRSAQIPLHSINFDVRPEYHRRQLQEFTLKELKVATDKFSDKNILGGGGFGRVYKGQLADGSLVAIKRMYHGRKRGISVFESEVMIGSIIQPHLNLLPILGFCRTPKSTELLLVYPFMINMCLASCLRERKDDQPLLDWSTRRKIAVGAARGLSHLHDLGILHRDIKAANIMLDEEFEPHIGDFGLALLVDRRHGGYSVDGIEEAPRNESKAGSDGEFSHVTTVVIGTIGHIAPEYLSTGKCSVKNDVFAFGIMLLGLVTGERAFYRARLAFGEGVMLLDWVKAHVAERKWKILVDPYLQGAYDEEEIGEVTRLALLCTQSDARERPSMAQVVRTLEGHPSISIEERWEELLRRSEWSPPNTDRADELSGPVILEGGSPETLGDPRGFAVKFFGREPCWENLKAYTLAELKRATRNFRPDTILGEGGFGEVFKGWVDERTLAPCKVGTGIPVAVKKSNLNGFQGFREWQTEVEILGKFSHPNLVRLLGYCREDNQYLLVYEFMQRGSLENHLFRRLQCQALGFRASKVGTSKRVFGTYGYAAPEYIATGHLYVKSDVYGFGVVLLEMLTGVRAIDRSRRRGQQNLVEWARPSLHNKRKLRKIMDPRLEGQHPMKAATQAAELILKCLEGDPKARPSMVEVLVTLERINTIREKKKEAKASTSSRASSHHQHHHNHHRSPIHHNHSADGPRGSGSRYTPCAAARSRRDGD